MPSQRLKFLRSVGIHRIIQIPMSGHDPIHRNSIAINDAKKN